MLLFTLHVTLLLAVKQKKKQINFEWLLKDDYNIGCPINWTT